MIRKLLLAIGILLSTSMVSHAGVLAGGPLCGHGTDQRYAFVLLYNAGTTPVTIVSKEVIALPDVILPIANDNIPADNILLPGHFGRFYCNITGSASYAARVTVEGSAEAVSGAFQIMGGSPNHSLAEVPMRPIR